MDGGDAAHPSEEMMMIGLATHLAMIGCDALNLKG
jgi:hypothetical protein